MAIYQLDGQAPELPGDGKYFIADTATVIGKVRLHNSASVWFGAVLRGDNEWIEIGENSNVQDNSTCHTGIGFPLTIGRRCTVGHNAILHGCTIEDDALIGMGSIIMNGARIGRGSIVGAGAVITEGKQFPEHSLIIGAPARVIRALKPEQVAALGRCAIQERSEEDRLRPARRPWRRHSYFFLAGFGVFGGDFVSAALLRSASLRSTGTPCFLSKSANASSASS